MAQIDKPNLHFNTVLYTGANKSVTGVGFQPDWVWIKERDAGYHSLFDALRGTTEVLSTNVTGAGHSVSDSLTSFDSDGFTLGADSSNYVGGSSQATASWNWKANGQGSSNTDGSTNTTYTSVNSTAGFSISTYAGTGSAATIGHGLGAAPEVIIIKSTTHSENWVMYHKGLNSSGAGTYIYFTTAAAGGSGSNTSIFNNTAPTSSVFTVNTDGVSNGSGKSYVAYCFKEKAGYSKFGTYTGNSNANGTFVYTGFKPAFVIVKISSTTGNWYMFDSARSTYNQTANILYPDLSNAEYTGTGNQMDILSNGFKLRSTNTDTNGGTHIYMAFAENPIVGSNNIPAVGR